MKRHAYLILAHQHFAQLRKLVELLDDPRNDIFIHVDLKARFDPAGWNEVCRYSRLVFLEHRIKVSWGGVSIMRSELALLKEAMAHGKYDYYHLLSGMVCPLRTRIRSTAFLTPTAVRSSSISGISRRLPVPGSITIPFSLKGQAISGPILQTIFSKGCRWL